ncbi:MAG: hypothetical protein HFF49_08480 [Lawsonibacter sp.]|nr:hypothetical protein [Lawsonibacter sp.]
MTTIGVDLGTSGCKAAAIRTDGTILSDAYQEYTPVLTPEGGHELDVEAVLAHAIQVIQQVASECGGEEIAALSVSSLGETVVPLDRNGSVLFPGILYSDPRGKELEEELIGRLDLDRFYRVTGYMPSRASSLCRIMWLKRYRPELYEQAVCFLPLNALLLHRLGAKAHIDFTLASTSQAFDIWKNRWDLNILSTAQIDPAKLPQAVPPGTTVGQMDKKIARELGLENTPLLVAGGHDQPCVSLGAGVIHAGEALDGMGSVEAIGVVVEDNFSTALLSRYGLSVEPHVIPGMFSVYGCTMTAGRAVKWFRDNLCRDLVHRAAQTGEDVYSLMFDQLPEGNRYPMWVPYFSGAGTPFNNLQAEGILTGVTLDTDRGALLKALLEGIAFELEINLECLKQSGLRISALHTVGGLARSTEYLQMKADIMGQDIVTLRYNEAGVLGAAILAAMACGAYPTWEQAVSHMVRFGPRLHGREAEHGWYQKRFSRYKRLHPLYQTLCQGPEQNEI